MNKKEMISFIIMLLLLFITILGFVLGLVHSKYKKTLSPTTTSSSKKMTYLDKANNVKNDLEVNWTAQNKDYPIEFVFSNDSKDFIVLTEISKKDYNNYIKYKANVDVEKTWNTFLSTLQKISEEGYNEFIDDGFYINYYFKVKNPNNKEEYIAVVKNGIVQENFMNK